MTPEPSPAARESQRAEVIAVYAGALITLAGVSVALYWARTDQLDKRPALALAAVTYAGLAVAAVARRRLARRPEEQEGRPGMLQDVLTAPSVLTVLSIIAGLGWIYMARGGDWRGWVMAAPATVAVLGGLGVWLLSPVRR